MNEYRKRQALNAHLRDEISVACGLLTSHARSIAIDAEKITARPHYDPPVLATLAEAGRVLADALFYVRGAYEKIQHLPVEEKETAE